MRHFVEHAVGGNRDISHAFEIYCFVCLISHSHWWIKQKIREFMKLIFITYVFQMRSFYTRPSSIKQNYTLSSCLQSNIITPAAKQRSRIKQHQITTRRRWHAHKTHHSLLCHQSFQWSCSAHALLIPEHMHANAYNMITKLAWHKWNCTSGDTRSYLFQDHQDRHAPPWICPPQNLPPGVSPYCLSL